MNITTHGVVMRPMYDHKDRKYIDIALSDSVAHCITQEHYKDVNRRTPLYTSPLKNDNVLTIKVPFRYRRPMCLCNTESIYSYKEGDPVEVTIKHTGLWILGDYSSNTWVLKEISPGIRSTMEGLRSG